ncbi:FtsX-like permease family protein [Frankia sp. QA3]|uniref:FtsX-like permease family protein n=1 Tax=Frankia sp. QA3 TaxID=710111 RepID=UPI000269C175|nr:FtsX-like permease family protein [Frankia sp. QA3]EIV92081.1 putative ABC-type transport system involved in lysophospholipase L1 biosynthesis, permease component [Frankia sp. QA3]
MIRLGLRLTLRGGRQAAARLALIAVAVALGVAMLLATLAGINAVNAQNARYAWLATGAASNPATPPAGGAAADPLWWLLSVDQFHGEQIGRVDVAATGAHSPLPPGLAQLPGPGQFSASPALAALLRTTPAAELGARFPGRQIATLGPSALPSPDSLIIIVGRRADQLAGIPQATQVTAIATTPPSSCSGQCFDIGINANGIDLVLSVVTAALLFPVLIFIGTATRLSAARREQRFAAMRLIGATPRQISVISAVESSVAAIGGVAGGFGLFCLLRPALAPIPFTGAPFFADDLSLNLPDVALVAIGVPIATAVAARLALRRVTISPLGVTRQVTARPPRAWRVLPLLAGLGELAWFVHAGSPASTPGQVQAYLSGILLTMAGLITAGPWLTLVGARLAARRTHRPAVLIAGRRLADNPQAGFRAISGLVLALFVTSVAVGIITTINAYGGSGPRTHVSPRGPAERHTLLDWFLTDTPSGLQDLASVPTSLLGELRSIPGVTGVTVIHTDPGSYGHGPLRGVASCAELHATATLGRCPAGADTATLGTGVDASPGGNAATVWPAAALSSDDLHHLGVQSLAVGTNGPAAVERARTVLQRAYPYAYQPVTIAEDLERGLRLNTAYQQLASVVILTSLPIAGASLAVSVVAGLNDRRRPFSLLRLAGAPLGMLRRVVALESALPLLVLTVVSIGTGFLAAGLFLRAQLHQSLQPPAGEYYLIVLAGLLASLAVIASTFPLLRRITGPEAARSD